MSNMNFKSVCLVDFRDSTEHEFSSALMALEFIEESAKDSGSLVDQDYFTENFQVALFFEENRFLQGPWSSTLELESDVLPVEHIDMLKILAED